MQTSRSTYVIQWHHDSRFRADEKDETELDTIGASIETHQNWAA